MACVVKGLDEVEVWSSASPVPGAETSMMESSFSVRDHLLLTHPMGKMTIQTHFYSLFGVLLHCCHGQRRLHVQYAGMGAAVGENSSSLQHPGEFSWNH
jgi:hypothetical protein